jgi:hypothetical protein
LKKSYEEMNCKELKLIVVWYKHVGDPAVPTTRTGLLERLHATIGREDPIENAIPSLCQLLLPAAAPDTI